LLRQTRWDFAATKRPQEAERWFLTSRKPTVDRSGQRRKEKGKELARFRLAGIESGGLRKIHRLDFGEELGAPFRILQFDKNAAEPIV
jgi:hypothetical protein